MDLEPQIIKDDTLTSKRLREPLIQRRSVASQKTRILYCVLVETTKLKLRVHLSLESRWKKRHVLWCEPLMMTYSVRM
jgi:hypothetical protein